MDQGTKLMNRRNTLPNSKKESDRSSGAEEHIRKVNNALENIGNGTAYMEERVSKPKNRHLEMILIRRRKRNEMLKKRKSLGELFSSFGKGNIRVISIPGKRRRKEQRVYLKK